MLSNYFAAALRNFSRNRAYSIIVTLSLAIGFAAMMLAAIYWRYEHSYDRGWPNADRVYLISKKEEVPAPPFPGQPKTQIGWRSPAPEFGPLAAKAVTGVEAVTRIRFDVLSQLETRRIQARARMGWIDGNFFDFFPPKLIAGDLGVGTRPGGAVITRSTAETFYGRADVVGETIDVVKVTRGERTPVRIGAVIEDWPVDTHLDAELLIGGGADKDYQAATYLRVRKGVSETDLRRSLQDLTRRVPATIADSRNPSSVQFVPVPLRFAYNRPKAYGNVGFREKMAVRGLAERFMGLGALMLAVSAINFVNLMTARGAGRAVEVGVRKVVGARRRDLVLQFVCEGLIYAGLAFVLALALVELTRPLISSMTSQPLPFSYGASLDLLAVFLLGVVLTGVIASLYPALVLSSIRPARAVRNEFSSITGSSWLRQGLVVVQFIPLLILAGGGIAAYGQQRDYLENSLKLVPAQALLLRESCDVVVKAQLSSIPGVRSVACLGNAGYRAVDGFNGVIREIGGYSPLMPVKLSKRRTMSEVASADRDVMSYYDTQVIAGKLWSTAADERGVVLNRDAARAFGYEPQAAIGQLIALRDVDTGEAADYPVIGVVENQGGIPGLGTKIYVRASSAPSPFPPVAGVRFDEGADLALATAKIDEMFMASTGRKPRWAFDREELAARNPSQMRSLKWVAISVGVGMVMAIGGIFAMAVFLANLRTREIGIRKAFGASRVKLLRMLIFQFAKPVLIANLVATPVVFWLSSQSAKDMPVNERSTLGLLSIAAVVAGSVLITVLASASQAWRVTGKLPLKALRSE